MNWDEMTARERDALVVEKVFGDTKPRKELGAGKWSACFEKHAWINEKTGEEVGFDLLWSAAKYTTDIAAAWEVVEKMREKGFQVVVASDRLGDETVVNGAGFRRFQEPIEDLMLHRGLANAFPESICLAALRALGVEV